MDLTLSCGCSINKAGAFTVGEGCSNCKECNTVSQMHPFGDKRLGDDCTLV